MWIDTFIFVLYFYFSPISKENIAAILNLLFDELINNNSVKLVLQHLIEDPSKTPIQVIEICLWFGFWIQINHLLFR